METNINSLYHIETRFTGERISLYNLAKWKNGLAFKNIDFSESGLPIIKIAELNNGISSNTAFTEQTYSNEVFLTKGDLVFSWSGNPETSIDIFRYNLPDGWLNQHIFKVTPNEENIDKEFFFYVMKFLKPAFKAIATNKQTTGLGHVTIEDLKRITISLPPLPTQKKIAEVLSCLDAQIELNRRINENLEQQAGAIFKEWFVDNAKSEWKVGKLEDVIEVKYGKDHKALSEGVIPVFGSGGVMRYVDKSLYDKESVLIPRKGTLNNIIYVNEPFWSVDTMFYSQMKKANVAKFVYFYLKSLDLASMNAGSAVPSMTTEILKRLKFKMPDDLILQKYDNITTSLFAGINKNNKENKTLAQIRDTLLPKLMNASFWNEMEKTR